MDPNDKSPFSDYRPVGSDPDIDPNETRLLVPRAGGWSINFDHPKAWMVIVALVAGVGMLIFSTPFRATIRSYLAILNLVLVLGLFYGWVNFRKTKKGDPTDRPYKPIE